MLVGGGRDGRHGAVQDTGGGGTDVIVADVPTSPDMAAPPDVFVPPDMPGGPDVPEGPDVPVVPDVPVEPDVPPAPPAGHTDNMNGVWHFPGKDDPLHNCTACHGAALTGGAGPSCHSCHDADDHTSRRGGVMHRPGTSGSCTACHGPNNSGGLGPACSRCH